MSILTAKEAKKLSLIVWKYLKEHPEVESKNDLPDKIFSKIRSHLAHCTLCEYFIASLKMNLSSCEDVCPLRGCISEDDESQSMYHLWKYASNKSMRKKAAEIIYKKILAWKI